MAERSELLPLPTAPTITVKEPLGMEKDAVTTFATGEIENVSIMGQVQVNENFFKERISLLLVAVPVQDMIIRRIKPLPEPLVLLTVTHAF